MTQQTPTKLVEAARQVERDSILLYIAVQAEGQVETREREALLDLAEDIRIGRHHD